MRRTLAIICFLAGISSAPLSVHAQSADAAQQEFVNAFLSARKGEDQEKAGDLKSALTTFRSAATTLTRIKQESPSWQADLVDFRLKRTMEAIDRIQGKMGGGKPGAGGAELGVLPPLPKDNDPLQPDGALNPPVAPPRGKSAKGGTQTAGEDPLGAVRQRITDLEEKLSEANDRLRKEIEKNARLANDMTEAVSARKKAEDSRKKAQDLAEVYQTSMRELKAAGESNSDRVKDLETKLAAVNRTTMDTQVELAVAEERINQLLGRTDALVKTVREAGTLPTQVRDLQAKLEAEQLASSQRADQSKKREEDLKNQIATLTKNQSNMASLPVEVQALQVKLQAEQKASADEAAKAKRREEDLKGQIASITQERNDAKEELVRLRELNKQTDKLMADNASLLKKLGDYEKQILTFQTGKGSRDTELTGLRKQVVDTQKALTASNEQNTTLQTEIGELQKKVTDYSKQIAQFKADKTASIEERKKMEDENRLLQGIVMRVLQEDANRSQRKKMIQNEIGKLQGQSDVLLQQINYLTQPVVKLSPAERKLFKNPVLAVQDPNTLAVVWQADTASGPQARLSAPAAPGSDEPRLTPPTLATGTTGATPPTEIAKLPTEAATPPTEVVKPPTEMAKLDTPPTGVKPKTGDDLPTKGPAAKGPEIGATPSVTSVAGANLPTEVKPLAEEAKRAFEKEKFADAERIYDKALQQAPNNVYLLSNRAVVQFRMAKYKQAEESFKKALAIAPEDAFCWSTIGIVYYSEQKFDEAVNALTKSLAINPKNPTAHNYLGITAAQKGWFEAAQKELETAVQLDPKYADAWFNLAVTHTLKEPPAKEDARSAYTKAVALGAEKDPAMEQLIQ